MRNKRFLIWLSVFLGIFLTGQAVGLYLIASVIDQAPIVLGEKALVSDYFFALFAGQSKYLLNDAPSEITTGYWVMVISTMLSGLWTIFGVWKLRDRRWGYWLFVILLSGIASRLFTQACEYFQLDTLGFTVIRFWFLLAVFLVGLWLIQIILFGRNAIVAVARATVMEVTRMRVAIVFVLSLFIFLPLIRYNVLGETRLTYQIQSFIYASMMTCSIMLCLMTVFVSCQTICDELYFKQIFLTMSKPISRFQYLMGKWLGITLLNALLVAIACGGTYIMTQSLATSAGYTAADINDYKSAINEVMVARESTVPYSKEEGTDDFEKNAVTLAEKIATERYQNNPDFVITKEDVEDAISDAKAIMLNSLLVIPPLSSKEFYFRDLQVPVQGERVQPLQLFIKPTDGAGYPEVTLEIRANGYTVAPRRQFKSDVLQVVDIPGYLVNVKGELVLEINNQSGYRSGRGASVRFEPGAGLNIYRKVGSFGPNLCRGFLIIWFELIFLSILGISLGGAMSFPVATLCSMFVFMIAFSSDYLIETMNIESGVKFELLWKIAMKHFSEGSYYEGFVRLMKILGGYVVNWMPKFGIYDPAGPLSQGQLVSMGLVSHAAIVIVVIWSSITAFIGWLLFRARELARVVF